MCMPPGQPCSLNRQLSIFQAIDLSAFPTRCGRAFTPPREGRCTGAGTACALASNSVTHLTAMPQAEPSSETLLDADIAILGLSLRASNVLRRHDLHTVRDVTRVSPRKLFVMTRLGRRSVAQFASSVERRGLRLAEDVMRETGAIDGAAHR